MTELKAHPAAEIFPLMTGQEFDGLVADIKENGQRDAIVLHENLILDGRNRYRACRAAGVEPKFRIWVPKGTVEAYVVSKNLHRRHLNESQRAMVAARLLATVEISTPVQNHDVGGKFAKAQFTAEAAGEMLNVNRHTVFSAKKVLTEGTKEEVAAVEQGQAAVSTIAKQIRAKQPPESRQKKRGEPQSQVGKNPERIQRQQINAEVWGRVRDALTHLTSLPIPTDVVAIARAHDKTGLVDARLVQALNWLKDFSNVWNGSRSEDAA